MSEELSAAAIATLYLVANQYGSILLAEFLQSLCKLFSGQFDATHALNALQDDGAHIAFLQFLLPCCQVVQRQVGHVAVIVDGRDDFRVVGHLHGQTGPSVEGLLGREYAGAPVRKRGQLQRVFVGFGAAVYEKQLIVVVAADGAQPFGQFHLQPVNHRIAVESQLPQLFAHLLHIVRMRVTDADDGMPAIQVQILLSLIVPDLTALSPHDVYIEQGIYVK